MVLGTTDMGPAKEEYEWKAPQEPEKILHRIVDMKEESYRRCRRRWLVGVVERL